MPVGTADVHVVLEGFVAFVEDVDSIEDLEAVDMYMSSLEDDQEAGTSQVAGSDPCCDSCRLNSDERILEIKNTFQNMCDSLNLRMNQRSVVRRGYWNIT